MRTRAYALLLALLALLPALLWAHPHRAAAAPGELTRVTLGDNDRQVPNCTGDGYLGARDTKIDSSGRYVLFRTRCSIVVKWGSTQQRIADGKDHLYVRDLRTGHTYLVDRRTDGKPSNGWAGWASFAGNGRWVAFASNATNFPDNGDQQGALCGVGIDCSYDVYLANLDVSRDGQIGEPGDISVTLVSSGEGESAYDPTLASNADYIAYTRITPNSSHIVLWDRVHDQRFYVDRANGQLSNGLSFWSAMSNGGDKVAFVSRGSNLVPGDTNGEMDLFLWTRASDTATWGTVKRLNTAAYGGQSYAGVGAPSISEDGDRVAFWTAGNLAGDDTNGLEDAYVWDARIGHPVLITTSRSGGNSNGVTDSATISASGRYLSFTSRASNLVAGDTNGAKDVFIAELWSLDNLPKSSWRIDPLLAQTYRVTFKRKPTGTSYPGLSNGDYGSFAERQGLIVFQTLQPLVSNDTNGAYDGYIYKLPVEVMAQLRSRR